MIGWIGVGFSAFLLVVTAGILMALHSQYWLASRGILLCINPEGIRVLRNGILVHSLLLEEIEKVEKWGPFSPNGRIKEYYYYRIYSKDSVLYVSSLLCEDFESRIRAQRRETGGNSPFLPTLNVVRRR